MSILQALVRNRTQAFSVSVSPAPLQTTFTNSPPSNVPLQRTFSSAAVTTTPSGGTPGYTYSWARQSGSTAITCDAPTAQNPTFTVTNLARDTTASAAFRVTVTDSSSATATFDITVEFTYLSGF